MTFLVAIGWSVAMAIVMAVLVAIAKRIVPKTLRARWIAFAILQLVPWAFVVATALGAFVYPV